MRLWETGPGRLTVEPSNSRNRHKFVRRKKKRERDQEVLPDKDSFKGNYHNDYSPRYGEAYDIYDKARRHARDLRRRKKGSI